MAGKVRMGNYSHESKKHSMKNLNISPLSLPVNDLSEMFLADGCPCERTLYSGAPYVQCGCCYAVYHVECFFAFVKHLQGEMIHCPVCHKEVSCDADLLLVPPRHQVPRHDL